MRISRFFAAFATAVVASFGLAGVSAAQDWPTRPVKIVAPFAPGGAADTLGRIAADHLSRDLGQQFFVENRPGAGGMIGSEAVAKADPDGYTFVVSGIASHVIAPALSASPPFDPMKDFTHIAYLGGPPIVLVVHPSLGVKTYKEFIAAAKKSQEGFSYVSPGQGTHGNLFAEYLARKENIKLTHVPYRGSNPAMADLIAGHVKVGAMTWSSAASQIRAGNVLALAVSTGKRLPEYPNVPTFKELGYPDLVAATWFSLSGPAGVPKPIVTKLNAEIVKIMQLPDVQKRLDQDAIEVETFSADEFTKFVASELDRWRPIAKLIAPAK
ncbi:MAG TPA: tripartite tricarboxylate transporter substrate binding protein [Xanthobacteraceae bacterium]|jgi:tripartite-type tricarboxylate transporter receptor subunit TctC|nr:tripartite tricarboxylate transporter substrate binding protein [Xanthobacteraceae bacterium]